MCVFRASAAHQQQKCTHAYVPAPKHCAACISPSAGQNQASKRLRTWDCRTYVKSLQHRERFAWPEEDTERRRVKPNNLEEEEEEEVGRRRERGEDTREVREM